MYGILGIGAVAAFFGVMWQLEKADHKVTQASYEIVQRNEDKQEIAINGLNKTIIGQNDNLAAMLTTNNFIRDQRTADRAQFDQEIDKLNAWRRNIRDAVVRSPQTVADDAGNRVIERMRDIGTLSQRARSGDSREDNKSSNLSSRDPTPDTPSPE